MTETVAEAFWSGWVGYSGHLKVKVLMKMKKQDLTPVRRSEQVCTNKFLIFPLQS